MQPVAVEEHKLATQQVLRVIAAVLLHRMEEQAQLVQSLLGPQLQILVQAVGAQVGLEVVIW
jgi:hypothetical protein